MSHHRSTETVTATSLPPTIVPLTMVLKPRTTRVEEHATIAAKAKNTLVPFRDWMSSVLPEAIRKVFERVGADSAEPNSISKEQADEINLQFQQMWEEAMRPLKQQFMEAVKVNQGDSSETVAFKMELVQGVMSWLHEAFTWVIGEMKKIFGFIAAGVKLAWEKAKQLFATLVNLLDQLRG